MSNSVSFSGLGSGIDFNTIRDAILTSRSRSVTLLQRKVSDYNGRIEALKTLNTGLAGLSTAAKALTSRDLGFGRATTTSSAAVATATAAASTAIGTYDLNVTRLASNLTQSSRSYSSQTSEVLAGGATEATFELRKGGSAEGTSITINSSNNTLSGLRDAINAAGAGVRASIIDVTGDGTGNQLVLTSDETGSAGRVELVETSTTGTLADLNLSSINPVSGDFTELNSIFSINGLQVTRGKNSVDDTINGVTINLKSVGQSTLSVVASTDIENRLKTFINQYNAIQDFVKDQYTVDSLGRPKGALAGESTLRGVQQQLRDVFRTVAGNNGGSLNSLSDIGVKVIEGGKLELNAVTLNEQLTANPENVRSLLFGATASNSGIFNQIDSVVAGIGDSVTGSVQVAIKGYQSSIETVNKSINSRLANLDRLRTSLTRQFAAADAAIGQLNGQGATLTSIIDSLNTSLRNSR